MNITLLVSALFLLTQPSGVATEPQAPKSQFSGRYFGYEGRTLHTWEFNPDATFLHTRINSGAGTNVRESEKGTFRLVEGYLLLKVSSAAGGFTTPSVGGNGTLVGGSSEAKSEERRVKIEFLGSNEGNAVVLDGIRLKVKSW